MTISLAVNLLLTVIAVPAALTCAYLTLATILSAKPRRLRVSQKKLRFDIIVPAHDEGAVIGRTVAGLRRLNWPADRFRVLVVADNCGDQTAAIARAAGAEVLERNDAQRRGKGYALAFAFAISASRRFADAVIVVDADSDASENLLDEFAARIERGAAAVQAHYGVRNPFASWRTRLIAIAKASFHIVRSRARERLGLSCGIRGNGWCVTHEVLRQVPYAAFSLTEDLEYGIDLGLAGYRVVYADEAHCDADMVSSEVIARKQRQRWEDGRFQLIRSRTFPLLKAAAARRSLVCLDLALDLLVLPLSYVALNVTAIVLIAAVASRWQPALQPWLEFGFACAIALIVYVLRGWQLSGTGLQGLLDLARAPAFILWKVLVMLRRRQSSAWVRTDREPP